MFDRAPGREFELSKKAVFGEFGTVRTSTFGRTVGFQAAQTGRLLLAEEILF